MKALQTKTPWLIEDIAMELSAKHKMGLALLILLALFLFAGTIFQIIDPTAAVLDIGILSVLLLGLLGGIAAVCCSLWLQEILWKPFKLFRRNLFYHIDQLTSWQQCILYFSVFFLLLYAAIWMLSIIL
ncbi:hypothetical protein FXV77_07035 [Sphingobacterium phlebotomi]|uniref:Uncharacterized protein n=1 Tax=Sphingobacterium phlebotomi TaxID=2605433 RepID=A0A5D4H8L7_9SPHI|nr:hypothetical protein [Sphingobacterium phlebotomi]TYR36927.1 hypothetical protein FXV77_07035 [Sphingobacterium phlebotomi]